MRHLNTIDASNNEGDPVLGPRWLHRVIFATDDGERSGDYDIWNTKLRDRRLSRCASGSLTSSSCGIATGRETSST